MNHAIKWVAQLTDVEEASVLGRADLSYWADYLRPAGLLPVEREGNAQILIVAAAGRFAGVRFRELSFSVLVSRSGQQAWPDAACLLQAFNSCRCFALCERFCFSTPYDYGDVRLAGTVPAAIELARKGRVLFGMQMQRAASAKIREPVSYGDEGWEGAVFLPDRRRQGAGASRMFFARSKGYTKRYPFLSGADLIRIEPSLDIPVFEALLDSHFAPTQWVLREKATHAKSKTYRRGEALH